MNQMDSSSSPALIHQTLLSTLNLLKHLEPTFAKRILSPDRDSAGKDLDAAIVATQFHLQPPPPPSPSNSNSNLETLLTPTQSYLRQKSKIEHLVWLLDLQSKALRGVLEGLDLPGRGSKTLGTLKRAVKDGLVRVNEARGVVKGDLDRFVGGGRKLGGIGKSDQSRKAGGVGARIPAEILECVVQHLVRMDSMQESSSWLWMSSSTAGDIASPRPAATSFVEQRRLAFKRIHKTLLNLSSVNKSWRFAVIPWVWRKVLIDSKHTISHFLKAGMTMNTPNLAQRKPGGPLWGRDRNHLDKSVSWEPFEWIQHLDLLHIHLVEPDDSTLLRTLGDRCTNVQTLKLYVSQLKWSTLQHLILSTFPTTSLSTKQRGLQHLALRGSMEPSKKTTDMHRLKSCIGTLQSLDIDFTEANHVGDARNRTIAAFEWLVGNVGNPELTCLRVQANLGLDTEFAREFVSKCSSSLVESPSRLHTLSLDRSQISPHFLSTLLPLAFPLLRVLCLSESSLTDPSLISISHACPFLESLNVSKTSVTDTSLTIVSATCPNLKEIYADDVKLSPTALSTLLQNTKMRLEVLSLHNYPYPNEALCLLAEFTPKSLRRLDVFSVRMWGKDIRPIHLNSASLRCVLEDCGCLMDLVLDLPEECVDDSELRGVLEGRFLNLKDDAGCSRGWMTEYYGSGNLGILWKRERGWL
ncbi:hypothetical protein HDV05_002537 [Chytridiales sp. JEL 0842]|nr:hypothetical protein HDV05_002537 [Chytridiales sp. JEL 0842]